jgi:Calcium binding
VKRPVKDPIREERIENEAIVDAYGPEEKAMGWYYYLEGKMRFPFQATCIASTTLSPLKKGDAVQAEGMASEDVCSDEMLITIRWQGRKFAVPLSQLAAVDGDESLAEAIADWHYWVAQGYLF